MYTASTWQHKGISLQAPCALEAMWLNEANNLTATMFTFQASVGADRGLLHCAQSCLHAPPRSSQQMEPTPPWRCETGGSTTPSTRNQQNVLADMSASFLFASSCRAFQDHRLEQRSNIHCSGRLGAEPSVRIGKDGPGSREVVLLGICNCAGSLVPPRRSLKENHGSFS